MESRLVCLGTLLRLINSISLSWILMLSLRMFLVFSDSVIVEQILKRIFNKYSRPDNSASEKLNYF